MIQKLTSASLALFLCCALVLLAGPALAQQSLTIGSGSTQGATPVSVNVSMTNTAPVEGFVLAITFDASLLNVTAADTIGAAAQPAAELVVIEIFNVIGGITYGVVMDAGPPFDGQTIPTGASQAIASMTLAPQVLIFEPDPPVTTPLTFSDGVLNNPVLDNIIVEGGLSIGAGQGLGLNDGSVTLNVVPPDSLSIESTSIPGDPTDPASPVRVLMENLSGAVQGYVLAITHNPAEVALTSIDIDGTVAQTVGAEFVVDNVLASGGTLGVVLDFGAPFDGQTIATGSGQHIANYNYRSLIDLSFPEIDPPPPSVVSPLTFTDGTLGSPPLDNVIVVAGLSLNPGLNDGTITLTPVAEPVNNTTFSCEATGNFPGQIVTVCFNYADPDDNIQGFQIAVTFDCNLEFLNETFTIAGSIVEEVGAEFVTSQVDNDPNDGDGCEFIAGILLDALPPFENQTVPQTVDPLLIGCIEARIKDDAPCGTDLPITYTDNIDGAGNVFLENIVVINFESIQNFFLEDCAVSVVPQQTFQRGDCTSDDKVDLADAARVIGHQFQGVPIDCQDACDANDDGKINLADSVFLLNWLFLMGMEPPAPGPFVDGPDGTLDDPLECNLPVPCL